MSDLTFNTTNESKDYKKPKIPSGEYAFTISKITSSSDKSKTFFIIDIDDQKDESGEQVSLVWSAPVNEEYTPGTNLGKLLLSVGINLGNEIKAETLIGLKGKCIVTDYAKQESGKTLIYSVVNDLVIPTIKEE